MRIIVFIIVFHLCFVLGLKAQNDSLTIREAFNWKVGDTLVYKQSQCLTLPGNGQGAPPTYNCRHFGHFGFNVISRTDLNDTIIYIVNWFTNELDTLMLTSTNNNVKKIAFSTLFDMMYYRVGDTNYSSYCSQLEFAVSCDSVNVIDDCIMSYYTDSIINSLKVVKIELPIFEMKYNINYVEKIGLKDIEFTALEYLGSYGGCGMSLVYYKSDSLMWVDSSLLYTDVNDVKTKEIDFTIYPNPTTTNFIVTLPSATKQITITNTLGQVLQTHETGKEGNQLQISLPESGTYFVHVTTTNATVTKKVICMAAIK